MVNLIKAGGHYLTGAMVIGSLSALAAVGVISGDVAVPIISATGTALIGGGLVHNATAKTGTGTGG